MPAFNPLLQQQFLDLIGTVTGIKIRSADWDALAQNIIQRSETLSLPSLSAYYQLLLAESQRSEHQQTEWKSFLNLITIGESYFFRDPDQLQVLREHILPTLIEQQRLTYLSGCVPQLSLSLWSAGCSTGEEPYSLAILLKELIPDFPEWQISILATDLNPASLAYARQGIYRDWSFRQTSPLLKSRYFRPVSDGWQIHESIRQQVTFCSGNLLNDPLPNALLNTVHLILCRNVFIYFDDDAIATILKKFHSALSPDGYVVTGHAELYNQNLQEFQVLSFPGSMAYQRQPAVSQKWPKPTTRVAKGSPTPPPRPKPSISIKPAKQIKKPEPLGQTTRFTTQYLLAQSHWKQQELEQAVHHCEAALQLDGEAIPPLYLKAQIAQKMCDRKQAKIILKKILYLQPAFIPAYLDLGTLYQQGGDIARAKKMYRTTQNLLEELPTETWIDYQGGVAAGDLLTQLQQQTLVNIT